MLTVTESFFEEFEGLIKLATKLKKYSIVAVIVALL